MFAPKYDLTRGFPDSWITSLYEKEIALHLYNHFFGQELQGVIVNCTWGDTSSIDNRDDSKYNQTAELFEKTDVKVVLFYNFVDDYNREWDRVISLAKQKLGKNNVKLIGYSHLKNDLSFQFWPLAVERFFTKYKTREITPCQFDNLFVCYNRKPHLHRKMLLQSLKKENLLNLGVFTLGNKRPKKAKTFEKNKYSGNNEAFADAEDYGVPNDLMSLGSLKIWNNSFLCIVTETLYIDEDNRESPFLTEKLFKPILGKKPFVVLGPDGVIKWLQDNGFFTYNDILGLPNKDLTVTEITKTIRYLSNQNLDYLYQKCIPRLEHNYDRFWKYCSEEKKRLKIDKNLNSLYNSIKYGDPPPKLGEKIENIRKN